MRLMRSHIRPLILGMMFTTVMGTHSAEASTAPAIPSVSGDQIIYAGGGVSFSVGVTGDPSPILQWRRDGAPIVGATSDRLQFNAALTDSGSYTVLARNIAGAATSAAMKLVVVEGNDREAPAVRGTTVRLNAPTLAKGVTFHWQKNGADITPSSRISGITASQLVIAKVEDSDAGGYTCIVTSSVGSLTSGQQYLVPVTRKPVVVNPISAGDYFTAVVAQSYYINAEADFYPDSFAITGLPPGLTVNTKTGEVKGEPRKAGTFHVKVTATNALGTSDPVYYDLTVIPLDATTLGTQRGLWPWDDSMTNGLGGLCSVTMSSTGAYTASVVLGTRSYSTTGLLKSLDGNASAGMSKLPSPSPLYLWVSPDPGLGLTCTVTTAPINDGTSAITCSCRKSLTSVSNAGRYTFSCGDSAMGNSASNIGWFTLGANAVVSGSMRMIDGTSVTLGGSLTTEWNVLVFSALYNGTGSLRGTAQINSAYNTPDSTAVSGGLIWFKKPQTVSTRSFKDGFTASLYPRGYGWPAGEMAAFAKRSSGSLAWPTSITTVTNFVVSNGTGRFAALYSDDNSSGWRTFSISGSTGLWSGTGTYRYYPDYYDQTIHIDRGFTALGLMVRDSEGAISCPGYVQMVDLPDVSLGTTLATSPMGYYPVNYTAGTITVVGGSYTGGSYYSGGLILSTARTLNFGR